MDAHTGTDTNTDTDTSPGARTGPGTGTGPSTAAGPGPGTETPCSGTELIVVGGGPAGVSGALMAAGLGLRVTLVEARERIGGRPWEIGAMENVPGGWRDGPAFARALADDIARLEAAGRCTLVRDRAVRVAAYEDHAEVSLAHGAPLTGTAVLVATGVVPLEAGDADWIEARGTVRPPPLWCAGPDVGHALVLGGDRPLGTWLRTHPEAGARLEVLHPRADAYKVAEVAADPRVHLYEVERATVQHTDDQRFEVTAHGTDGGVRTFGAPSVLANLGMRPSPPAGDLVRGPEGYCPLASQSFRLLTAGDLRSARHQRITPAQGSGAEAALTYYYAAHG
ncbi:FAD-dependent oxidoreductase [Streptomyces iconiensis]|uniref:FAD-dependent oxidoreductase n=1 Tax=Streptomyces iconiensis TaxID=1384038 RepID=A0ABT7A7X0_9ACTN|nr:FAD-dependent oxidoreductase [Streptomyces iconiensis]MDJ1137432.1 FAD-dependent oxidoreductase [Streptomyces iconiensis]